MIKLKVEGMSCGHCIKRITDAIQQIAPAAPVRVDLVNKDVVIDATREFAAQFAEAISAMGYQVAASAKPESLKPACRCCA